MYKNISRFHCDFHVYKKMYALDYFKYCKSQLNKNVTALSAEKYIPVITVLLSDLFGYFIGNTWTHYYILHFPIIASALGESTNK